MGATILHMFFFFFKIIRKNFDGKVYFWVKMMKASFRSSVKKKKRKTPARNIFEERSTWSTSVYLKEKKPTPQFYERSTSNPMSDPWVLFVLYSIDVGFVFAQSLP